VEKKTEKGSARIGCKGHFKAKFYRKGGYSYYDIVDLKHNHKLTPDKRMVCFMRSHKYLKDGIKNIMDVMTRAEVPHTAQMNGMSYLHDGRDNWTFTEQDFRNRFKRIYNFQYVGYSSNDSYMCTSVF
jgi:hypothetical protein